MESRVVLGVVALSALVVLSGCVASGSESGSIASEGMATESSSVSSDESANEHAAAQQPEETADPSSSAGELQNTEKERQAMTVTATLNGQDFSIELADNDTAHAFAAMLPLSGTMTELNGNEKYLMIDEDLPSAPSSPGAIEAGDVLLYQDNCIVIFYEAHPTSYSYTRIGKIADATGLAAAVGSGSVEAAFSAN